MIADIVQANSTVRGGPYVKVNVGALPDTLMEAELFGTEAGAFTGAKARTGRFEAADGGTIFLDELGNLSAQGQAKLLRVLQTGEFERLGSNTTRRTRARVIAATNANLPQLIQEGRFREDLLYRLNVIELEVPPLAARQEDIVPLAQHFLEPDFTLSQDALRALARYHWPGNVRELRNAIHRACLLSVESVVTAKALALPVAAEPGRWLAHRPRSDRAGAPGGRWGRGARRARPRPVAPGALSPHGEARPQGARRPGPHDRERLTPPDLAR